MWLGLGPYRAQVQVVGVGAAHGGLGGVGPWTAHWVHGGLCPPSFSPPGSWWNKSRWLLLLLLPTSFATLAATCSPEASSRKGARWWLGMATRAVRASLVLGDLGEGLKVGHGSFEVPGVQAQLSMMAAAPQQRRTAVVRSWLQFGAKRGSYSSIGVKGEPRDSIDEVQGCNGVLTAMRCTAQLW